MSEGEGFEYLGNYYTWTSKARNEGIIDCTCEGCQRFMKSLVEEGQLKMDVIAVIDGKEKIE